MPANRRREKRDSIELVELNDFFCRDADDGMPFLVEELIPAESYTIWQGRPKVGKSQSLLQVAFDAATGIPVFGRFNVPRPVRVCYVELEESEVITKQRLGEMIEANDHRPKPGMLWFLARHDLHRASLLGRELLTDAAFTNAICERETQLVIFIALRVLFVGDPNESRDAERFNETLRAFRDETGAAIVIGHHTRKAYAKTAEARGFGSTMLAAATDGVFDINSDGTKPRCVKVEARFDAPEEFFLCLESIGEGKRIRAVEDPAAKQTRELRELMAGGKSGRQAAREMGIPLTTAQRRAKG